MVCGRWVRLGGTVAAVGMLMCGVLPARADAAPPTPVGSLRVVSVRPVVLKDRGRILSLSPDGTRFAATRGDQLCLYSAVTLARQRCVPQPGGALDRSSLAWSPDSRRLAFTEDWAVRFVYAHIWTLDAATGKLTNLTDNGATGSILGTKIPAALQRRAAGMDGGRDGPPLRPHPGQSHWHRDLSGARSRRRGHPPA